MAFAIGVETIMAHRKPAIWAQRRSNLAKNTISCELEIIREIIEDSWEDLTMRKIYSQKPNKFNLYFLPKNFSIQLSAKLSLLAYSWNFSKIILLKWFRSFMNVWEMTRFMLFHMNSIGFKSGEYGGRKINLMPHSLAHFIESFALWARKLSRVSTISFVGLWRRICLKKSHTSSFFECSLKSITGIPFTG